MEMLQLFFSMKGGSGECLGVWVKIFGICGYPFLKYKGIQAQNVQASVPEPPISHYFE